MEFPSPSSFPIPEETDPFRTACISSGMKLAVVANCSRAVREEWYYSPSCRMWLCFTRLRDRDPGSFMKAKNILL